MYMPGAGVLPVAFHKGKLYFLMGKENPMEDTSKGFSDFGGGIDKREGTFEAALREASEELSGFLGTSNQILSHIKKHGGFYKIERPDIHDPTKTGYTLHIIHMDYDPMLPVYYNNNHTFLWQRMNKKMLNASKLFEKIEIQWVCEDDLKRRMREYRSFFRETVTHIMAKLPEIRKFIKRCTNRCKSTIARKSIKPRNRTMRGGQR
jgi:NUDIX domain